MGDNYVNTRVFWSKGTYLKKYKFKKIDQNNKQL